MIKTLSNLYRNKDHFHKTKYWFWGYVIPSAVLIVLGFKIYYSSSINSFQLPAYSELSFLLLSLTLLPANVLLESWKWQLIAKNTTKITFWHSIKIVLSGKSLNIISPFGIGDGLAKYLHIDHQKRNQSYALIVMDRLMSMIPTLFFGVLATGFLIRQGLDYLSNILWAIVVLVVFSIGLSAVVFNYRYKLLNHFGGYLEAIRKFDFLQSISILAIASLRYAVFSFQFYLIMRWCGITLPYWILLLGIFWIFFVKTIIPDFTVIGDLLKREVSAVTFFSLFLPSVDMVVIANVVVWFVNIIIPSFLGLFLISDFSKIKK